MKKNNSYYNHLYPDSNIIFMYLLLRVAELL